MPIFTTQLGRLDYTNSAQSLRHMANHLRYVQEQLEYTLASLDSSNVTAIETDVTQITSGSGALHLGGGSLRLKGNQGEVFQVGLDQAGNFQCALKGKNGVQMCYLTPEGNWLLTKDTAVMLDCGQW